MTLPAQRNEGPLPLTTGASLLAAAARWPDRDAILVDRDRPDSRQRRARQRWRGR